MRQKFFRGQRVRLTKEFPQSMLHFEGKGCEAIVAHSYSDQYGCGNFFIFCLLIIPDTGKGKPFICAWYPEKLMTLVSSDRDAGERLLQEHNERVQGGR